MPQPLQPLDQHRVGTQRGGPVDQPVEQLVVAGGGEPEAVRDGLLLGSGEAPPLAFEIQDLRLARGELVGVGPDRRRAARASMLTQAD